jgi:hypothetical protein
MRLSLFIAFGLAAFWTVGCTDTDKERTTIRELSESVSYPSPEQQDQLKAALAAAHIRYHTELRDGQEHVVWDAKDSAAVKAALVSPLGPDLPSGRSMNFSAELREEFEHWLKANNVSYFSKSNEGREYLIWSEQDDPRVREWLRARLPEAVYAATLGRVPPAASGRK